MNIYISIKTNGSHRISLSFNTWMNTSLEVLFIKYQFIIFEGVNNNDDEHTDDIIVFLSRGASIIYGYIFLENVKKLVVVGIYCVVDFVEKTVRVSIIFTDIYL